MSDVFKAMLALVALFVLAAWGFAGGGITGMVLTVVSYVFLVAAGLTVVLWLTRQRHPRPDPANVERVDPFGLWTSREIEISTGRIRGSHAVIQILLPVAAVAVGMTAFAVVLHFAGHA